MLQICCNSLKRLAPTWEKVGNTIGDVVKVGKIDCTEYQPIAKKYGVRGFPTIMYFRNGKILTVKAFPGVSPGGLRLLGCLIS